MRILFLSWRDLRHPQAGGSEVLVDELASGLFARGHDVTLLAAGPLSPHPYRAVEACGRLSQYITDPLLARRLGPQDVIVDVCNGVPFFSPLWTSTPVVLLVNHIHFGMWREWFSPPIALVGATIETKAMPRLYRHRRFVAVSESTAKALGALGVPDNQISIVHNGVDVASVGHRTTPRAVEPTFLAVGRLVPHKRFDLLLRAWAQVQPEVGGRLLIAGDGPLRERLQLSLPPGAELLGWVSEARKRELMETAWLLVQPSRLEGWGLVVMEAAAAGTPTLGFWAPGTRDAVEHHSSGILVRTERELVDAWISLARDTEQRRVLAKGAEERAMAFSWTRSVDAFQQVLLEAAGLAVPQPPPPAVVRLAPAEAPRRRPQHDPGPPSLGPDRRQPFATRGAAALARRGLRRVRRTLGDNPVFLPVVLRATPLGTSRRITPDTELVIEGYPRSGNTFAHFAVLHAEPGAVVTSRVHTPSQVKRAVAKGTPTLLTIRGPIDSITSTALAAPHVPIRSLLEEYIHHYEQLYPYLDRVLVATFDEITNDFDSVIDALNERFSLGFRRFGHTAENTAAVFAAIEEHHREHWGADQAGLPVPSETRRALKEQVRREVQRPEHAALLFEAQTVHDTIAARGITASAAAGHRATGVVAGHMSDPPAPPLSQQRFYEDLDLVKPTFPDRTRVQLDLLRETVERSGRPSRVLDLGCGEGLQGSLTKEVVGDALVVGVDLSEHALSLARSGGLTPVKAAVDGPALPFPDASFDVVVFSEVIEHVVDTDGVIDEILRVLVHGGTLLISTPNLSAWFNRGLLACGVQPLFSEVSRRRVYGRPGTQIAGHLRLFTHRAFREFLADQDLDEPTIRGAAYHGLPKRTRWLDRLIAARRPSLAAVLVARATKP